MGSRQKYRKIEIGPMEKITSRNSLNGMVVLADSNQNGKRVLVLERPTSDAPKPVPRKKKAVNGSDKIQESGLAFPGSGASSA